MKFYDFLGLLYDGQAKVEVSSSTLYESVVLVSTLTGEAGGKKKKILALEYHLPIRKT